MKKIYQLLLLASSMCFAEWNVFTSSTYSFGCLGHDAQGYSIHCGEGFRMSFDNSKSNQPVNGFKISIFFNAAPGSDFSMEARRVLVRSITYGLTEETVVEGDNSIQPMNAYVERISAVQYKAVFDYSNVTIPARGRYPADGMIRLRSYNTTYADDSGYWIPYGHTLRGYVVESPSGEVLTTSVSHYTPDPLRRIGVLTNEDECPNSLGTDPYINEIRLDTEDSNDQTRIADGDNNPLGIEIDHGYIKFRYCTLMFTSLPRVPYDYIVLKLDSECPQGSYPLTRHHDTENDGNINESSGFVWPNVVVAGADATLEYCFVPKDVNATRKYPFDKKYGVFSRHTGANIARSHIYIDDEDSNNGNYWYFPTETYGYRTDIEKIMSRTSNTDYYVIKWTGSNSAMLSKSAAEVTEGPIPVENTLVAAAPLAPAVKGLNRNVVAVELKSAGDVKVSIVGVNGAVVAGVSEKNLQAGVHQIKWNAGMVPSGRYVVKVEQNGMVNAKSVILK